MDINYNVSPELLNSLKPMDIFEYCHNPSYWVEVDNWYPLQGEEYFRQTRNAIILPVSEFYGVDSSVMLDNFMLTPKRCYNSDEIRLHICRYLNYFERFYDKEHELLFYIYRIKALMDIGVTTECGYRQYTMDEFKNDIKTYILSESIYKKTWRMVEDNYQLELNYKNKSNEGLQYSDRHGKYLMEISIFMNILIPLMMHFVYKNRITSTDVINELIFNIYNWLFDIYIDQNAMAKRGLQPADIYSKLYETSITTMESHYKTNGTLWDMSAIRGYSPTINANDAVNIVIMQVMPKYTFKGNVITYNITSVRNNIKYNISDISYEYDYVSLSSSKRDGEDNTSQFDKFEAHLQKTDEGLVIQNDYRAKRIMQNIVSIGGDVSDEEIKFYRDELTKNGQFLINRFQQNLINNMFYKFFGDTVSINSINGDQYITLIIIAKRLLLKKGMKLLPYIISSSVTRISTRTSLCKKEIMKIEQSEYYNELLRKYNGNEKIIKSFLSLIATTLSSGFRIIDYDNKDYNGIEVVMESDIIIDEMIRFILEV